jgi:hypothetical protein
MSMAATEEMQTVLRMLARERLAIDEPGEGRTCFLSHVGAQARLAPGAWIGHRDLLYALALANLSQTQRSSLARAVVVEHGQEFGVGRLQLEALPSGLPLGGSSLLMQPRGEGPRCLSTWALGDESDARVCDWLLLRAQPDWALDDPPAVLNPEGLATLAALGEEIVILLASAVAARQVADMCTKKVDLAAHPRFSPHLEGLRPEAKVLLWPHDAIEAAGLLRHQIGAVVLVGVPERVRQQVEPWIRRRGEKVELAVASCPGRAGRDRMEEYWRACGQPRVLLRGDPAWARAGEAWLREIGAEVEVQGEATQLGLF